MTPDSPQAMLWASAAGVSAACFAYVVVSTFQMAREEAHRFSAMGKSATAPAFKILRPIGRALGFLVGGISARVEMALGRGADQSFLRTPRVWAAKRLRAASHPEGVTPDEFLGFIVLGGLVGCAVGILVNIRLQFGPVILLFAIVGMYWPLMWLRGRLRRRQDDIRAELPYAIDLLTISVEAGLDFTEALARIAGKLGVSPLAFELGQTLRDIQLGRTRAQALRQLSERVELSELNSLTSALIQADELGASLGPILRIQSDFLRTRRSQRAEKLAMEAPVKILLPLILFIFPTIFIMIFGPIALKFLHR